MSILSRPQIVEAIKQGVIHIDPWSEESTGPASVTLHLGNDINRLVCAQNISIDQPETYPLMSKIDIDRDGYIHLKKHEVLLASTLESVGLPNHVAGWLTGTSDLARLGVQVVLSDFVAPGFGSTRPGVLALELVSHAAEVVRLRPKMRVGHLVLTTLGLASDVSYDELADGYAGEAGIVGSRLYKRMKFETKL
ncbi:dCTP deaminase [Methylobacterium sp. Gmos1]